MKQSFSYIEREIYLHIALVVMYRVTAYVCTYGCMYVCKYVGGVLASP